jgi:Fission yeast centromere protein N-terminal domain
LKTGPAPSHWMHVDLFTVDQAAALWAGFDPARVSPFESMRPSELVAAGQMLLSAIVSGAIPADSSANALSCIGNFSRSFVARRDLEAFARKRQIYPAFLFDTLAPFGAGEGTFGGDADQLKVTQLQAPRPAPNRGGRPAEYDWDRFILEVIRRAHHPDGLPPKQADLVQDMLSWFSETYGKEPAESAVKARISKIYKYLDEDRN